MDLSIIGAGYVGLITGLGFAKKGNNVFCVDIDQKKVDFINQGRMPIYERGGEELLASVLNKNFTATSNLTEVLERTDVTFLCVGTPSSEDGRINLDYITGFCKSASEILHSKKNKHYIIVKSTVVPGTCSNVVRPYFGDNVSIAMNPEFLREGRAIDDFLAPDRIVVGSEDKEAIKVLENLYSNFGSQILTYDSTMAAEMIKYASNAFLATKISFINEVGNLCKKLGLDTHDIAKGIGLDKRIGPLFLNPGIGFGGSCFPKDVSALIHLGKEQGYDLKILRTVMDLNSQQPYRLIDLAEDNIQGKTIGILGMSFKADTDDIRDSPALTIINKLHETNNLVVYDPKAMENARKILPESESLSYMNKPQEVIDKSDVVFILTDWDEFKELDYNNKTVYEGKRILDKKKWGKNIEGVCW